MAVSGPSPSSTPVAPTSAPPAARAGERPPRARRERFGLAEWLVGLSLLLASVPGPWLTLGFPAGLAFALHDRRVGMRVMALAVLAGCTLLATTAPGGPALVAMAAGAVGAALAWTSTGRAGALDRLSIPAMAGAVGGWGLARLAAPAALGTWEATLRRAMADGGAMALDRYRALGMDPDALAALAGALETLQVWMVKLWPALAALALWMGAWWAGRLLARWGRIAPDLAQRLAKRPFATFAVGEPVAWLLIVALVGLWVSASAAERLAANAALVAIVLFALDGLAIVWWWFERRRVSMGLRVVAVALALGLALPLTLATMVVLGLADVWIQFRSRPHLARPAGRLDR